MCDRLIDLLTLKFSRTLVPLTFPIVVHAVAGAGKTTFLNNLLVDPIYEIVSLNDLTRAKIHGNSIKTSFSSERSERVLILDEYLQFDEETISKAQFIFSDPYQSACQPRLAHFTCNQTQRFGNQTAEFLRKLNFDVVSDKIDELKFGHLFNSELSGTVIGYSPEVCELLSAHCVEFLEPCRTVGLTFNKVTLVLNTSNLDDIPSHILYISLTRHIESILILTPDASYSSTRL
uniref:Triple gene block protein 1 n=1 Tax=Yam virus X TaxID=1503864 RepID=A0A0B4VLN4_9VIRU|nr:triple gene block protein 1 [Yam virus X]